MFYKTKKCYYLRVCIQACRNFYDDGVCTQECPPMQRYNPITYSWETNPLGKYAYGATCVKNCPEHLLKDNGACVRSCPPKKKVRKNNLNDPICWFLESWRLEVSFVTQGIRSGLFLKVPLIFKIIVQWSGSKLLCWAFHLSNCEPVVIFWDCYSCDLCWGSQYYFPIFQYTTSYGLISFFGL